METPHFTLERGTITLRIPFKGKDLTESCFNSDSAKLTKPSVAQTTRQLYPDGKDFASASLI